MADKTGKPVDFTSKDNPFTQQALSDFGDCKYITVLVTGSEEKVTEWMHDAAASSFDGRDGTYRMRIFDIQPFDGYEKTIYERLEIAIEMANKHDVTLQLLSVGKPIKEQAEEIELPDGLGYATVAPMEETYSVLHLASNGEKWGDE